MPPSPSTAGPTGRRGLRVARLLTSGILLLMCLLTVTGQSYRDHRRQGSVGTGRTRAGGRQLKTDITASMAGMSASERREAMATAAQRAGTCAMKMTANATLDTPGACTAEQDDSWQSEFTSCHCNPRETIVSLHNMETSDVVLPPMVAVNRCGGWCFTMGHSCMAISTASKSITLRQGSSPNHCISVNVEEDVACSCMCPITADDCTEKQNFRADLCLCQCKKTAEYRRGCGAGRRWDSSQCQCVCREQRHCSTGLGWSEDYCRCFPMTMPDDSENLLTDY